MDATWTQLLVGLLAVAGYFLAIAAGVALLAVLPIHGGQAQPDRLSEAGRR